MGKKRIRLEDGDLHFVSQIEQVTVAGNDEIRFPGKGAFEDAVVGFVATK